MTLRGHEYPIGQILRVLGDRTEYREGDRPNGRPRSRTCIRGLRRRQRRLPGSWCRIILAVTFSLDHGCQAGDAGRVDRMVLLIIAFLMGIELMRDHLRRQVELGNLDDEEIRVQLALRDLDRTRARRARRRRRARTRGPHAGGRAPDRRDRSDRVA